MRTRLLRAGIIVLMAVFALPVVAHAQHTSPSYEIDEVFIGGGGQVCDPGVNGSTNYCADQSVGGIGGSSSSANYGILAGFNTPDEPTLFVSVTNSVIDMGVLSDSTTAAEIAEFSVGNYVSDGYRVIIEGLPPTNVLGPGTHSLDPMDGGSSTFGTEQFGINLVANTDPIMFGADPEQEPDNPSNPFSYGQVFTGYGTPNQYKYEDGGLIAYSDQETGLTNYTMSMIANISNNTPGGQYYTILVIQAISVF